MEEDEIDDLTDQLQNAYSKAQNDLDRFNLQIDDIMEQSIEEEAPPDNMGFDLFDSPEPMDHEQRDDHDQGEYDPADNDQEMISPPRQQAPQQIIASPIQGIPMQQQIFNQNTPLTAQKYRQPPNTPILRPAAFRPLTPQGTQSPYRQILTPQKPVTPQRQATPHAEATPRIRTPILTPKPLIQTPQAKAQAQAQEEEAYIKASNEAHERAHAEARAQAQAELEAQAMDHVDLQQNDQAQVYGAEAQAHAFNINETYHQNQFNLLDPNYAANLNPIIPQREPQIIQYDKPKPAVPPKTFTKQQYLDYVFQFSQACRTEDEAKTLL
ncbi:MAG: hypothetical protein ACRC0J_08610, partial [Shewanella oncorhynchi]